MSFYRTLLLVSLGGTLLSSCGQEKFSPYPHTGSESLELKVSASLDSRSEVQVGQTYFVKLNGLRLRSSDTLSTNANILGVLGRNDKVKILESNDLLNNSFVKVEVLTSRGLIEQGTQAYLSFRYLQDEIIDYKEFEGEYFMVQNIATERLRVYKRICEDNSCPHKMVLQTQVAMGEDKEGERTMAGSYRITDWRKFYQDGKGLYPSWYDPNYPPVPGPDKGVLSWFKDEYLPPGDGEMRGAFGWYAALVEPNHKGQWTHGTIGWGENKDEFIVRTKKFFSNLIASPRSHGCTRADNETIAYLRHLLPVGTPLIKVYAIEKLMDKERRGYSKEKSTWDYILTTRGVRTDGQTADKYSVLASDVTSDEIIEEGTYMINQWPEIVEYREYLGPGRFFRKIGDKGNLYDVDKEDMKGVFYIDTGFLENYSHPKGIEVGGYYDEEVPPFMDINNL